jgi:hypothetical protein
MLRSWLWQHTLVIPVLERLRQEDHEFDITLGQILSQKTKTE